MLPFSELAMAHYCFESTERLRTLPWTVLSGTPSISVGRIGQRFVSVEDTVVVGYPASAYGTLHGAMSISAAAWVYGMFGTVSKCFIGFFDAGFGASNGLLLSSVSSDGGITNPIHMDSVNGGVPYRFGTFLPDMDSGGYRDAVRLVMVSAVRRDSTWSLSASIDGRPLVIASITAPRIKGPPDDLQSPDDEEFIGLSMSGGAGMDEMALWKDTLAFRRAHGDRLYELWNSYGMPMSSYSDIWGTETHPEKPLKRRPYGWVCDNTPDQPPVISGPSGMQVASGSGIMDNAIDLYATDATPIRWEMAQEPVGIAKLRWSPMGEGHVLVRYAPPPNASSDAFVVRAVSGCMVSEWPVAVTIV